ncbi:MAG: hypothetical protein J0M04_24785 [Verrucomicrobia bacterium]|nr:hypothetical protein [Verrucomicrobiota bacterium]
MNPTGDKLATTRETALSTTLPAPWPNPKRGAKGKPVAVARFGSASVPVYRCASGDRIRFALSYHREGRRMRQFFTDPPPSLETSHLKLDASFHVAGHLKEWHLIDLARN